MRWALAASGRCGGRFGLGRGVRVWLGELAVCRAFAPSLTGTAGGDCGKSRRGAHALQGGDAARDDGAREPGPGNAGDRQVPRHNVMAMDAGVGGVPSTGSRSCEARPVPGWAMRCGRIGQV